MSEGYTKKNNSILGNSVDVTLEEIRNPEIRADVVVEQIGSKRIWGQIIDCEGMPISHALVKLVREIDDGETISYEGVAHTMADCQGFYQFDVRLDDRSCYKILVNKSVSGGETIIDTTTDYCQPCYERGCNGRK